MFSAPNVPRVAVCQLLSVEAALKVLGANGMLLLHWVPLYHTALRRVNGFASVVLPALQTHCQNDVLRIGSCKTRLRLTSERFSNF